MELQFNEHFAPYSLENIIRNILVRYLL